MLIDIPRMPEGQKRVPGTWQRVLAHTAEPEFRAFWTATVWCPSCHKPMSASRHSIADNGQISPSLGHPDGYAPCEWHTSPRLLGWTPNEWPLPATPPLETCASCGFQAHTIGGWGTWVNPGLICHNCVAKRDSR